MTNLLNTLLTTEDKDELKKGMKSLILNQFQRDLEESQTYLLGSLDLESWVSEALDEIEGDVKDEIKESLRRNFEEKLNKIDNEIKK